MPSYATASRAAFCRSSLTKPDFYLSRWSNSKIGYPYLPAHDPGGECRPAGGPARVALPGSSARLRQSVFCQVACQAPPGPSRGPITALPPARPCFVSAPPHYVFIACSAVPPFATRLRQGGPPGLRQSRAVGLHHPPDLYHQSVASRGAPTSPLSISTFRRPCL